MNKLLRQSSRITELLNNNKRYYFVYLFFGILGWILAYVSKLQTEWIFTNQHVFLLISLIINYFLFAYSFTLPKLLLKQTDVTTTLFELLTTIKRVSFVYIAYILITMLFSMLLANAITLYEPSRHETIAPLLMNQKLTLINVSPLSSLQPIKHLLEDCLSNIFLFYAPFFYALKGESALTSARKGISFFFNNLRFSLLLTIILIIISEVIKILPVINLWTFVYILLYAFIQISVFIIRLFYFQDHYKASEKA